MLLSLHCHRKKVRGRDKKNPCVYMNNNKNVLDMETKVYSTLVYEQLARQLATEQAEVVKHQAVVDGIKQAIFDKKKDLIMHKIEGRSFKWGGKKVVAIETRIYQDADGLSVYVSFAEVPSGITRKDVLTKKEKEVCDLYAAAFDDYLSACGDDEAKKKVIKVANLLSLLKHHLRLIHFRVWSMKYDEAVDPDFFKKTGLGTGVFKGCSTEELMLENMYCM